jgi:hypothetical protein
VGEYRNIYKFWLDAGKRLLGIPGYGCDDNVKTALKK